MSTSSVSSGSRRPSSVFSSNLSTFSDSSQGSTDSSQGPIVVYCETCSKALSSDCLTSLKHGSHKFRTIEEVCKEKMDKMEQQLENLTARDHSNMQQWLEKQETLLQSECQRLQDLFTTQYREIESLLNHDEEQTLTLMEGLRQGQKKLVYEQTEGKYNEKAKDLLNEIDILKKEVSSGSKSVCIKKIEEKQKRIDKLNGLFKRVPQNTDFDKSRLGNLQNSVQRIHEKISEILPRPWQYYEDITFSPDNADKSLRLSPPHRPTQICIGSQHKSPIKTYETEESMVHILAKESWKDGQHYWEVDVENCRTWAVGIVELPNGNKLPNKVAQRHLGRDKRSWMLESEDGELAVLHDNHLDIVKEQDVKRIGVFLDMTKKKSQLTFYNVGSNVLLHSFKPRFKKSVFPAFSLSNSADEVQSMVLCNLNLQPNTDQDSGAEMSSRSSTPESRNTPDSDSGMSRGSVSSRSSTPESTTRPDSGFGLSRGSVSSMEIEITTSP